MKPAVSPPTQDKICPIVFTSTATTYYENTQTRVSAT